MIGRISGMLIEKNPPELVVDCNGVGYEVLVPMSTYYNLPQLGEKVALLTHFVVREDAQLLYGFETAQERGAFRQLIKVSGIGPRTALAVLSGLSVADLALAIQTQEVARIVKVPGIGKKTAERLLLELKGKLGQAQDGGMGTLSSQGLGDAAAAQLGSQNDILQALMALGYSEKDASAALKKLPQDVEVSDGIRMALKGLS